MVLYRNLAGVEKTGAFRDTGTDCRTSFDRLLIGALIQGFLYLSLAGGVWCVGYMISEYFKESK